MNECHADVCSMKEDLVSKLAQTGSSGSEFGSIPRDRMIDVVERRVRHTGSTRDGMTCRE